MWQNPFKQKPSFGNKKGNTSESELSLKELKWGKNKFKPIVAPKAKEEPATHWKQFKTEIIQKELDEKQNANLPNINSKEAQEFKKKREENSRRMRITEKQKEPTKWENFDDDHTKASGPDSTKKEKKRKYEESISTAHTLKRSRNTIEMRSPVVDKEQLNNFNSLSLSFQQNNHLRKVITKTTCMAKGTSLKQAVKNLKNLEKIRNIRRKRIET